MCFKQKTKSVIAPLRGEVNGLYMRASILMRVITDYVQFYTENLVYSTKPKQGKSAVCLSSS
jgi:hypothetical protein